MIDKINTDILDDTFSFSANAAVLATNNATGPAHDGYFMGGHWGQCLELLQHLCQYSENIALVLGEAGLGKTTLKQALIATVGDTFKYCDLNAGDNLDGEALLQAVAAGFGIVDHNTRVNLAAKVATLSAHDDKLWLILLDDAHLLEIDALQALVNLCVLANTLKTQGKSRLRLVLFGKMGTEQKLEAIKLQLGRQENTHVLELEPLTATELASYLHFKWRNLGNPMPLPFDGPAIKKIWDLAAGNPRTAERLMRDRLAGNNPPQRQKAKSRFSVPNIPVLGLLQGMLVVAAISALAIFLLQPMLVTTQAPPTVVKIEMPLAKQQLAEDVAHDIDKDTAFIAEQTEVEALPKQVADILTAQSTHKVEKEPAPLQQPEQVLPRVLELERLAQEKKQSTEHVASPTQATLDSDKNEPAHVANSTAATSSITAAPQENVTAAPAAATLAIASQPASTTTTKKVDLPAQPKPGTAEKILSLPTGNFTVQLLGAAKISGIEQFIAQNKLQTNAYYYKSMRQNQPWYILLYGNYPSKEQAKAAIAALPLPVRALNPWVRDIASVKKALPKGK